MRFLGGIFLLALSSGALASEASLMAKDVKVRVLSTSSKLNIYDGHKQIHSLDPKSLTEPLELKGTALQVNAHSVPPQIVIYPKTDGSVDIVAVLSEQEYLKGVLPHEMPLLWPLEALKAQAVVARSFTRLQVQARKNRPYHLDSTVNDQMYRYNQSFNEKELQNLNSALSETQDEVLTRSNGQVVKALYHADCGGQTEKASQVWGQKEVEFSVKDSKCPATPFANWEYEISTDDLREKLKMAFVPLELSVSEKSLSQRAAQMEMIGLNSEREKISSQNFRKLVGYSKLKSTKFNVKKTDDGFLFTGSGYGHGVGLCQWGAKAWAQSGLNYQEILKHYFPTYQLSKVIAK